MSDILIDISLHDGPRGAQIFGIGQTFEGESHDLKTFQKFKNFTP